MKNIETQSTSRKDSILDAAIQVFGRYGYKKTSVDDIAKAAGISKQGLYLHFPSKVEVFLASLIKYLDDGVADLEKVLEKDVGLFEKILEAVDVWFGRLIVTFSPDSFDIIEVGNQNHKQVVDKYIATFKSKVAKALADSPEFKKSKNICSPREIANTLFICGMSWKEPHHESRADFLKEMAVCVRVCCQVEK